MLTSIQRRLSNRGSPGILIALTLALIALVAVALSSTLDSTALSESWTAMTQDGVGVALALASFGLAFTLRAAAWRRVLSPISFGQALAGIHLALGANHVLPLRLGEPFRVLSVVRRTGVSLESATASTVALRTADVATVVGIGWLIAPRAFSELVGAWGWLLAVAIVAAGTVSLRWLSRVARERTHLRLPDLGTFLMTAVAWVFEAVLVWHSAQWAGLDLSPGDALLVTTVAVAAQVAAFAPGGFGTYEAASVAAYVAIGHDAEVGLVASLTAHGLKTAYALGAGLLALLFPSPNLLGRFRLTRPSATPERRRRSAKPTHGLDAPIVLFMPALNEDASIGGCLRRVPNQVLGHRVHTVVIDDGSTDRTGQIARDAGAEVITFTETRGLGAGVREGLRHASEIGASAVAFCDADEEYPPEELENLIAPILDGTADYVIGSRFAGSIEHMRPHRRLGNVMLTKAMCFITRRRITDAQSGYRAFSPAAAAHAEVIHDFNYAQVLTLDLLAKGYRYHEVPISYHFRTSGDSFIKLGEYLRRVVPAVYRELNTA